jgi:uncharacterized Zn-binding protein involved in type VI secretion
MVARTSTRTNSPPARTVPRGPQHSGPAPRRSTEAGPPAPPLFDDTGCVPVDMMTDVIDEAAAPFRQSPPSNPVSWAAHYAGAAMSLLGVADNFRNVGAAYLTAPLAAIFPPLPPLRLGSFALGLPHMHSHPPSIPPGAPLPSLGVVVLPGAISVLMNGLPVARAGDVGLIISCCTLGPPFEISVGSSNVFAGGGRVARIGTDIEFHDNPAPISRMDIATTVAGAATSLLTASSQLLDNQPGAAAMTAAQQAADLAAMAIKQMRGKDVGLPPDIGAMLIGAFTVLVGGFPLPPAGRVLEHLTGLARALARTLRSRLRGGAGSEGPGSTRPRRGSCGSGDCPE